MRRAVLCLVLTACAPAAPPPARASAPRPSAPPPASASASPPASASASVAAPPRPASVTVEGVSVVGLDEAGKEIFRGRFSVADDSLSFESSDATRTFHIPLRRFPQARGPVGRVFAVGAGGVALTGAGDGSLIAVDYEGKPRFQLGVRGSVLAITARSAGGYVVTTNAGDVIIDPASPAPVEPPPRAPAPLTYLPKPPAGGRSPQIVLAADEAWALEEDTSTALPWVQTLHRFDGKTWTQVRVAALEGAASISSGGTDFHADGLERGPNGQLVLVGYERHWSTLYPGADSFELRLFERAGDAFHERRDLAPAYGLTTRQDLLTSIEAVSYAAGPDGREIACLMERCLARGLPTSFRPLDAKPPARTRASGWRTFEWRDELTGGGRRAMIFAGKSLYRSDFDGLTKDGKKLLDGEAVMKDIAGGKYPPLPDPYGRSHEPAEAQDRGANYMTQGLWASGPDDVWASIGQEGWASAVFRWNGKAPVHVPCPLPWVSSIGGSGPDDVWLSGGGGVAHHDGHETKCIPGIPPGPIVSFASGDVWLGRWRVTRATSALPDLRAELAATPPISPPSAALPVTAAETGLLADATTLEIPGDAPLSWALGVEQGPGNIWWLHDRSRLVELDGAVARVLYRAAASEQLDCQRCAAPRGPGEGAFLAAGPDGLVTLRTISKGRVDDVISWPGLMAVAPLSGGDTWAVSSADEIGVASALSLTAGGLRNVVGLPEAAYSSVAARAADDVWLSGGLTTVSDEVRARPAGEGVLVHFDGRAFSRYRGPEGALLSVAAVGPAEAWAVGLDGGIVHVKAGVATAYHLERDGVSQRVALRAVGATGPDDVWIAGDRSTLLRWNGKTFARLELPSVGVDASLTAVIPPRDKAPGWLVGPRGLFRIRWADKAPAPGP